MQKMAQLLCVGALAASVALPAAAQVEKSQEAALTARGEYLVKLGGCNDCHTDGFAASDAKTPMKDWLTGSALGFNGPWGTTYATNLRLLVHGMSEAQWLEELRTMNPKPPMPWWALKWMTQDDQRAVYAFIHSLGPAGQATPNDLPPGATPTTPVVAWPGAPPK